MNSKLQLETEEQSAYNKHFQSLQPVSDLVSIQKVVPFLQSSSLSQTALSLIWKLVEGGSNNGFNKDQFNMALKLVAIGQAGREINLASLSTKSALPAFLATQPMQPQLTGASQRPAAESLLKSQPSGRRGSIESSTKVSMVCSDEEKVRFTSFFEASGPVDGQLSGNVAKDIFVKSQLSSDILSKVWLLSEKNAQGNFSLPQFIAAMWIITKIKSGLLQQVPTSIPSSLLRSIDGQLGSPASAIFKPSISTIDVSNTPVSSTAALNQKDISEAERNQYISYFDGLDTASKGSLTGAECFAFFVKSSLPSTELSRIWEAVDIGKTGSISKEAFITAMSLIKKRLAGQAIQSDSMSSITVSSPAVLSPKQNSVQPIAQKMPQLAPTTANPLFTPKIDYSSTSMEAKELGLREQTLQTRRTELTTYEKDLMELKPSVEDLRKKREDIDVQYSNVTTRRNQVSIELSQLKAEYEMEMESYNERQAMLSRDARAVQAATAELGQYREAVIVVKKENVLIADKIEKQGSELKLIQSHIAELELETASLREDTQRIFLEAQTQRQALSANMKLLESTQEENKIVKQNLGLEINRLEQDRKKVLMVEQQASVQTAITEKEKDKILEIGKERKDLHESNTMPPKVVEIPNKVVDTTLLPTNKPVKEKEIDEIDSLLNSNKPKTPVTSDGLSPSLRSTSPSKSSFNDLSKATTDFDALFTAPITTANKPIAFTPAAFNFDTAFSTNTRPASFDSKSPTFGSKSVPVDFDSVFGGPISKSDAKIDFNAAFSNAFPPNPIAIATAAPATMSPVVSPSNIVLPNGAVKSEDINKVKELGFSYEEARLALIAHGNDVERAVNFLILESSSK